MTNVTFSETFGNYVYSGLTKILKVGPLTCKATIERDEFMGAPWEEHDGHGPVSEWTARAKLPGEMVLATGRHFRRYYDFAEAVRIAKADRWGVNRADGLTKGQIAAKAALEDFEALRAWCDDEWFWCEVVVTVECDGHEIGSAARCAIEANYPDSDNAYLDDVAAEQLDEALADAKDRIDSIIDKFADAKEALMRLLGAEEGAA